MSAEEFGSHITYMWIKAGQPSSRTVASEVERRTGWSMSHTTFNDVRRGKRVPSWPVAQAITWALDGDEEQTKHMWEQCRQIPQPSLPPVITRQLEEFTAELRALREAVEKLR